MGKKRDINDKRSDSLLSLIKIFPQLKSLKMILLENVTGFEVSEARNLLTEVLKNSFRFIEFKLNPAQFGIPNSRERYYLLAKRYPSGFVEQPDQPLVFFFSTPILKIIILLIMIRFFHLFSR